MLSGKACLLRNLIEANKNFSQKTQYKLFIFSALPQELSVLSHSDLPYLVKLTFAR
jgi:hypothetical protein